MAATATSTKTKIGAIAAAITAAIVGGDADVTANVAELLHNAPYLLGVLLYVELRFMPWCLPIREAAEKYNGPKKAPIIAEAERELELEAERTAPRVRTTLVKE
jgi:hypothetical protein